MPTLTGKWAACAQPRPIYRKKTMAVPTQEPGDALKDVVFRPIPGDMDPFGGKPPTKAPIVIRPAPKKQIIDMP